MNEQRRHPPLATDVPTRRSALEGVGFGLIAGGFFALMQMVAASLLGESALTPLRLFGSVLMGREALASAPLATVVPVGLFFHFLQSAVFGLVYGLFNAWLSDRTQTGWGRQAGLGLAWGAVLWLINVQLVARIMYPWFLDTPQAVQLLLHAACYGLPLALMYAAAERRAHDSDSHGGSPTMA